MDTPIPPEPTCSHFYKYSRDLQQLEALLLKNDLYVPTAGELNEPRDSHPPLSCLSQAEAVDYLRSVLPPPANEEARILEVIRSSGIDTIRELIRELALFKYAEIRIYSMSKRWDNVALWATLGANHSGYCLEFFNRGLFRLSREVIYTMETVDVETPPHASWIFYKASGWRHEEEVRFFMLDDILTQPMRILPDLLSRVILGKDMPAADQKRICRWAERRDPSMRVVRVVNDPRSQKLSLKTVIARSSRAS